MVVFAVKGLDYSKFLEVIDKTINSNPNNERPFIMGSIEMFEIECFNSELGKMCKGAEAIAMFIDHRREMLRD